MQDQIKLGQEVVSYLFQILGIDDQWSLREPWGFTWWAYRLAQRVWAVPVKNAPDPPMVRMHAETVALQLV